MGVFVGPSGGTSRPPAAAALPPGVGRWAAGVTPPVFSVLCISVQYEVTHSGIDELSRMYVCKTTLSRSVGDMRILYDCVILTCLVHRCHEFREVQLEKSYLHISLLPIWGHRLTIVW